MAYFANIVTSPMMEMWISLLPETVLNVREVSLSLCPNFSRN